MVAHDVNPILPYLDRVVYIAEGGAVAGTPAGGDHRRDAEPALRHPDRGAAHLRRAAGRRRPAGGARPSRRPARRTDDRASLTAAPRLPGTSSPTSGSSSTSRSWCNALAGGAIVAVVAGVVGWFMVLRRQSFAGHTLAVVGFPGGGRRHPARGQRHRRLLRLLRGGRAGDRRPAARGGRRRASARSRRHRGRAGVPAGAAASSSSRCTRGILNGVDALLFGTFLGITDRQVVTLLWSRSARSALLGGDRPAAAVRVGRPRVAAARGVPVRRSVARLPGAARRRRRRGQPDHRHPAGVRPARHARRHRPAAHRPARRSSLCWPSAIGRGRHLARALAWPTTRPTRSASSSPRFAFAAYVLPGGSLGPLRPQRRALGGAA